MADSAATQPDPATANAPTPPPVPPASKPDPAPEPETVRLKVPHPYGTFDPSLPKPNDKLRITADGTDVAVDLVDDVKAAWAAAFPTAGVNASGVADIATVTALIEVKGN